MDENLHDPYVQEERRLRQLCEELCSEEEEEEEDPYHDSDDEYGSDRNYVPSEASHSDSESSGSSSFASVALEYGGPELEIPPDSSSNPVENAADSWEDTTSAIPNFPFDLDSAGLKVNVGPDWTPLDMFEQLLTPGILEYLLQCSNNYGEHLCSTNRPKTRHSRSANFRPISPEEFKSFLGLCLLQGQVATTNMRRYFSYTDPLYYHPIFPYVMSARRFEQILRVLCCSSLNSKGKGKVQPLMNMLIARYQEIYTPVKELSIDESLLHYRGRLMFRVYIKNKKKKYGIKFFELTTSDGYLLNMEMYSGAADDNTPDGTKTEALVLRLMRPYLMKGHELFMDNYYNSIHLSERLLSHNTHTNGTLRSNRKGNPKYVVTKKLKKGEHYWLRRRKVYVSKWKDKRDVLMITTRNHPHLLPVKNRFGKEKIKPEEVATYNNFMSGIDRCDQMTSTYSTPRKTIRWYKKVILYLVDVTTWNAFYLYRKYCRSDSRKYRFIEFRDTLIKLLLNIPSNLEGKDLIRRQKHDSRHPTPTMAERIPETSMGIGHWPEKIPGVPGNKSNKKSIFLKCRMCKKKSQRKETSFRCKGCVGNPPLCPGCFEDWHRPEVVD